LSGETARGRSLPSVEQAIAANEVTKAAVVEKQHRQEVKVEGWVTKDLAAK
jgi:hypothetical protein